MKKLKSLYIGLKKDTSDGVGYLKGFIVENGTTKAHIANKIKVDNWRDKNIEPLLIDNTPMNGYSVKEVLSLRSSRGNNKCRILIYVFKNKETCLEAVKNHNNKIREQNDRLNKNSRT